MSARLLWMEVRRNERLWLFPLVVVVYGFFAVPLPPLDGQMFDGTATFWPQSSVLVRNAVALLAPVSGAVAAWAASREHRRGMEDLIATTPRPEMVRNLTQLGATALLGLSAFGVLAAVSLGRTATRATWDGPYFSVLLPPLVAIVAAAALGFALGKAWPRRIAPILAAAGLSTLLTLPINATNAWPRLLSPIDSLDASPWYGVYPHVWLPQSLLLLGFGAIGLAGVGWASHAPRLIAPALVAAVLLIAIGVNGIRTAAQDDEGPDILTYEPICQGSPVEVCVHPAFALALDDLSNGVNAMAAQLAGVDDVPARLDQIPIGRGATPPASGFFLDDVGDGNIASALNQIAYDLTRNPDASIPPGSAADVVSAWLMGEAGISLTCANGMAMHHHGNSGFGFMVDCASLERFAALDDATRAGWLRNHYADLRAGRITRADLP
ncbi:MAG: hypothetical protein ACRDJH_21155 [Thermomicrobiales bacterium]